MSTKTTFKRIALVTVAALGFGMLSVAPSSAAGVTTSAVTVGTFGPSRVGVATTVPVTITHSAISANDTATVTFTVVSKPATSSAAIIVGQANTTATESATTKRGTISSVSAASATVTSNTVVNATASATKTITNLVITPDVAGTYVILASEGHSTYTAGDYSATITITTAGTPASIALSTVNSVIATNGANGSAMKIVLKDADGNVTKPNATESIKLTSTTGSATFSSSALGSSAFASGAAIVNVKDTVASDSVVVTASGDGLIPSTVASSLSFTSSANASLNTAAGTATWQQGTGVATTGFNLASQTSLVYPSTATSQSIGLASLTANGTASETTAATTKYATLVITDTTGAITGVAGTVFDKVVSQGPAGATISSAASITATLGTTGSYTVSNALNSNTLTVTGATPVATTTGAISPATITAALASTNTFTAKVTDQFGLAFAGAAVQASVSAGRNSAQAVKNLVSDASGYVSYTLTDSGTTGTTDTVSFAGPTTVTRTLTYAAVTVGSVTLTGGNTTAGVTATTASVKDISANDGAEAGVQTFTATVKDASGNLVAGIPVTFSVAGTGAAVLSTTVTGYTTSTGTVSASVYAWIAGTYTVTATAGGKSGTGTITFAQTGAGDERAITVSADGQVVTAKVVDRFGNPVPGVTVYATKSGVGYFGAGVTKTSGTTATDGTVEFVITGGSADVTVSTLNYSAVAGTCPSGQTGALAGNLDCTALAADATAFTATTAGTAVKAEAGVGASYSAAGVSKATVSVVNSTASDAQDAAAEATDAANAATDAANAAAEAADAATAAAQDAADAVAALSTQVSEMIDALKKQITALTNLVIKIQKKVKA